MPRDQRPERARGGRQGRFVAFDRLHGRLEAEPSEPVTHALETAADVTRRAQRCCGTKAASEVLAGFTQNLLSAARGKLFDQEADQVGEAALRKLDGFELGCNAVDLGGPAGSRSTPAAAALERDGEEADVGQSIQPGARHVAVNAERRRGLVRGKRLAPTARVEQNPAKLRITGRSEAVERHAANASPCDDDVVEPETRYTKSGDVNIAFQVTGQGELDLVLVPGFVSHLERDWEEPRSARFLERLGSFARLIRFDKRGTGLSDRPGGLPDLETRMDDVRAVMDAVASERAALFGYSEGGPLSVLFAATYPQRTTALVLYGTYAKRVDPADDYPWAPTRRARASYAAEVERNWGTESDLGTMAPNADLELTRWWSARARASASPGAARDLVLMNSEIDVRSVLPAIGVPTLVLHRRGDLDSRIEEGRYIAERIPGARFVELDGTDHVPWIDADQILDEVEEFLTGVRGGPAADRVLATVVFTDIVNSTGRAATLGDRRWRELLDRHRALVRREVARFGGHEIDMAGDGTLSRFDGPARAVRSARAIIESVRSLDLEVRAGVHTGELELTGDNVAGIAVHIAARILAEAAPGEALVSSTVKDLVVGSGLEFEARQAAELRGVPGTWQLYAAVGP